MGSGRGKQHRAHTSAAIEPVAAEQNAALDVNLFGELNVDRHCYVVNTEKFFSHLRPAANGGLNTWNDFLPRLLREHGLTQIIFQDSTSHPWAEAQLQGINLSCCDIKNLKWDGANLRGALFHNTSANGISLRATDLRDVESVDSDFENANWTRARIGESRMLQTNLTYATLLGASIEGSNKWEDVTLRSANCSQMNVEELHVNGSDLGESDWSGGSARALKFWDCRLVDVNFAALRAGAFSLIACAARNADFSVAEINELTMKAVNAANSHWLDADIGSPRSTSSITDTNLHQANFGGAALHSLRVDGTSAMQASFRHSKLHNIVASDEENDFSDASFEDAKLQCVLFDYNAPMKKIAIPRALRSKLMLNPRETYRVTKPLLMRPNNPERINF